MQSIKDVLESIRNWLNSLGGDEQIDVAGVTVAIKKFNMAKFLAGLLGPLLITAWNVYRSLVANWVIGTAMWVHKATVKRDKLEAIEGFSDLFDKYLSTDEEWGSLVTAYFSTMMRPEGGTSPSQGEAGAAIEEIGEKWLPEVLDMVLPTGYPPTETGSCLSPQDGINGAERFLGMNMRFQMQGTVMQLIADMYGLKNLRALSQFPQNFSWSFGFGWLSWLVMGVPFRLGISEPMEKAFRKYYRSKDLTLAQIADFYWQDPNFREEGLQRLKEMGYTDDDIPRVLDKARKKLSKTDMLDLVRYAGMTEQNVIDEINASGHDEGTAQALGKLLFGQQSRKLIEDIARAAERQYKKGTITGGDLQGYLGAAGYKPHESGLILSRLNLERLEPPEAEAKETGLTRAMIGTLYKRGAREIDWVIRKLTEINWSSNDVADFITYYKPDEEKEGSGKSLTAAMIGGLYKRGWIPQIEAERLWKEINVRKSHIPLYTRYYTRPWDVPADVPPLKLLSPETVGEMYGAGILELELAVSMLVEGGLAGNDARLYLLLFGVEAEEEAAKQPALTIWEIAGAVADGLMSFSAGLARLVEAGYSQGAANNYLTLQVAYRVATNVSIACSAGDMTYAEALNAMTSAGWSPTDASIYLQQHWCKP